ncbi:hypothetical protein SAMN05444338_108149 [Flavobacterium degerlachei]|jgi:hypothetical protein|uniref:Uncharacterized protein n=1 Tax=Flavobacterium degerlachei TaxID=229203 RepID=A0A1H3AAF6_9FLAO|nr:hypothetical protein SAMN05444338_108149 [Flavobacterium degerlachei]
MIINIYIAKLGNKGGETVILFLEIVVKLLIERIYDYFKSD